MIEKKVKLEVSDVTSKMSKFLQDKFDILLRDLNDNDKYKPVKLKDVNWDELVAEQGHWNSYVLQSPEKK